MHPFGYVILALWIVDILVTIGQVGRRRDPITPATAVCSVIVTAILCVCLVVFGA